jgi:hypothetical protein
MGFSDQWSMFHYSQNSVCKFKISTIIPHTNLIVDVTDLKGSAKLLLIVMPKDEFTYPLEVIEINKGSLITTFNISGANYEFLLVSTPDAYSSGSYRVNARTEKSYQF